MIGVANDFGESREAICQLKQWSPKLSTSKKSDFGSPKQTTPRIDKNFKREVLSHLALTAIELKIDKHPEFLKNLAT